MTERQRSRVRCTEVCSTRQECVQVLVLHLAYWMPLNRSLSLSTPFFPYLLNEEYNTWLLGVFLQIPWYNHPHKALRKYLPQFLTDKFFSLSSFLHSILSEQLKTYLKTSKSLSSVHVLIHINPSGGDMTCKSEICFTFIYFLYFFSIAWLTWIETGMIKKFLNTLDLWNSASFHTKKTCINKIWL